MKRQPSAKVHCTSVVRSRTTQNGQSSIARERLVAKVSNMTQERRGRANSERQYPGVATHCTKGEAEAPQVTLVCPPRFRHGANDLAVSVHRRCCVRALDDRGTGLGSEAGCVEPASAESSGCTWAYVHCRLCGIPPELVRRCQRRDESTWRARTDPGDSHGPRIQAWPGGPQWT